MTFSSLLSSTLPFPVPFERQDLLLKYVTGAKLIRVGDLIEKTMEHSGTFVVLYYMRML